MRVHAWDTVFVRARRADVHPLVRDLAGHPRWWPHLHAEAGADGWVRLVHERPRLPGARLRLEGRVTTDRPGDRGLHLAYRGDLAGQAEWYYLDQPDGTVVHHLLHAATPDRGAARRLRAYRASVRAAMHALKDLLEGGRPPGAEPEPALLAHQREAAKALLPPARPRGAGQPG